jgi:hypothetical protein
MDVYCLSRILLVILHERALAGYAQTWGKFGAILGCFKCLWEVMECGEIRSFVK